MNTNTNLVAIRSKSLRNLKFPVHAVVRLSLSLYLHHVLQIIIIIIC